VNLQAEICDFYKVLCIRVNQPTRFIVLLWICLCNSAAAGYVGNISWVNSPDLGCRMPAKAMRRRSGKIILAMSLCPGLIDCRSLQLQAVNRTRSKTADRRTVRTASDAACRVVELDNVSVACRYGVCR
jgi:hypothetical protein